MGGGSILGGLILGAIAALIIDRKLTQAAAFAAAGAVLTFFGFMHSERIGIAQTPTVAFSYLVVSCLLLACAHQTQSSRWRRKPQGTQPSASDARRRTS